MGRRSHPTACSLPGARMIQPADQGDYDGLCGLYCIINAVRLVMAPHRQLNRDEARALFVAGVRFLQRRGSLPNAVHSCVREREWPKLAARIVSKAQTLTLRPITLEQPGLPDDTSIDDTLLRIEMMINAGKAPCVFLRGKARHYSVVSGYTPVSLRLFDSFGHKRILRRSCGTARAATSLHRFHLQSILTLTAS